MFARKWLVLGAALLAVLAGGLRFWTSQAASQISVNVSLSSAFVPANGSSEISVTANVTAGGQSQAFRQIRWGILPASGGSFASPPPTDTGLFDSASATYVAGSTPGFPQIVVTDTQTGMVGTATINQYGPSAHLAISLSSPSVTADGRSSVVATATATDSAGVGVPVDSLGFGVAPGPNGGTASVGPVTNKGDGTYSATITAGTKADMVTVTATDSSSRPAPLTASTSLAEIPGPASSVKVTLGQATLPSDGASTTTATAIVSDAFGNRRGSDTVTFATSGHVTFSPTVNNMDGSYTTTITASTVAGTENITAKDGSVTSAPAVLTVTPGPAANIALSLGSSSINTNPPGSTTATATVTDVHGNAVKGDQVSMSTNGHAHVGAVTDNGNGTYTATITAVSPGPETITATDAALKNASGQPVTATAPLTELGPPAKVTLTLNPTHIHVGTNNSTTATAGVFDSAGDPEPGITTTFGSSSGEITFSNSGTGTTGADGTDHVQANGVATAGPQTIYVSANNLTTSAVLTEYATPSSISVSVTPGSMTADGTSSATATVTLVDPTGNGVPGQTVTLSRTSNAPIAFGSDNGDGTYTFTLTSSTVAQTETLTATDASYKLTSTTGMVEVPGPPTTVSVSPNPASMTADGHSTKAFTATVTDANGNAESGQKMSFSSTGKTSFGPVTANGDGTYSATATAATTSGMQTITATDSTPAQPISGTAALNLVPGAPTSISVTPGAASLVADGQSVTTLTATVSDANSNGVYGEHLTVTTAGMGSSVTDNGDGTYTITLTATRTADVETVGIADGTLSTSAIVTENPGPASKVVVTSPTSTITTDQTSGVPFTATVTDANGNAVKNDSLGFAGNGGLTFGPVTVNGDGTYTAIATPSTIAGTKTITVTDGSVTSSVISGQATLVENAGAPVSMNLAQTSGQLVADGTSTMTLLATVVDRNQNGVPGQTLGVTSAVNGGGTPGITSAVKDDGDGSYTITLTSGRHADVETVTVTDPAIGAGATATPQTTASATITEVAGQAANIAVALTPDSTVTANATDQRTVTVTVTDANGNPVAGAPVTLAASGAATLATTNLTTAADGTASTLVTSSKTAGKETITATDTADNVQGAATLTENAGPAASIAISVASADLFDDGRSTDAVSALVKDANGNPVPNEQVNFSDAQGLVSLSAPSAITDATGTASVTARARTTTGTETITATDAHTTTLTSSATVTLADQDNVATFVKAAYETLLNRTVDANGLAYWGNAIRGGMSRSQFASTITSSTEYRTDVISRMYEPYLHRSSDSSGVAYWVGQVGNGATFEQVRLSFIGSPEYYQVHGGTPKGAVDALYLDVLGRPVDSAGEAYWVQQLNSHALTFNQLAASILYSTEGREHLVSGIYQNVLGRSASSNDLAYWANQLANGTRDEAIIDLFVGSTEYFTTH